MKNIFKILKYFFKGNGTKYQGSEKATGASLKTQRVKLCILIEKQLQRNIYLPKFTEITCLKFVHFYVCIFDLSFFFFLSYLEDKTIRV